MLPLLLLLLIHIFTTFRVYVITSMFVFFFFSICCHLLPPFIRAVSLACEQNQDRMNSKLRYRLSNQATLYSNASLNGGNGGGGGGDRLEGVGKTMRYKISFYSFYYVSSFIWKFRVNYGWLPPPPPSPLPPYSSMLL